MILARALLAVGLAAPIPPSGPMPPAVEAQCVAEGGCVWVSQKWLRERLQEAAAAGFQAGKKDAEVRCGRIL